MKKPAIFLFLPIFALVLLCGCATTTTPQGSDADLSVEDEQERLNDSATLTGPAMAGDDADAQETISNGLGIRVESGEALTYTDDHDGMLGDGTTFIALQCSGDEVLVEIKESGEWNAFPLDETTEILLYGKECESEEEGEDSFLYGPYVTDDDFHPLFPEVENGYYRLIDRYNSSSVDADKDILDRYSYNFTVGVYDTDTDILYYCQFDT